MEITESCKPCQLYAQKPLRFKFTLCDEKELNHTIYMDVFYISSSPVVHVVHEVNNYQAAKGLRPLSTEPVWDTLRLDLMDVYLDPPEVIAHDASKTFYYKEFKANEDLLHICIKKLPLSLPIR